MFRFGSRYWKSDLLYGRARSWNPTLYCTEMLRVESRRWKSDVLYAYMGGPGAETLHCTAHMYTQKCPVWLMVVGPSCSTVRNCADLSLCWNCRPPVFSSDVAEQSLGNVHDLCRTFIDAINLIRVQPKDSSEFNLRWKHLPLVCYYIIKDC